MCRHKYVLSAGSIARAYPSAFGCVMSQQIALVGPFLCCLCRSMMPSLDQAREENELSPCKFDKRSTSMRGRAFALCVLSKLVADNLFSHKSFELVQETLNSLFNVYYIIIIQIILKVAKTSFVDR